MCVQHTHTQTLALMHTRCWNTPGAMLAPLTGTHYSGPRRAFGSGCSQHAGPSPKTHTRKPKCTHTHTLTHTPNFHYISQSELSCISKQDIVKLESINWASSRCLWHFDLFMMRSFCLKSIKHVLCWLGVDILNTFHLILFLSLWDSLMLQQESTGMKCFKRTSPRELGQSPIKGKRDHKA